MDDIGVALFTRENKIACLQIKKQDRSTVIALNSNNSVQTHHQTHASKTDKNMMVHGYHKKTM
jgi:hypothetical protein